jgi:predicted transcriptional regulator of viral defense system
MILARRIFAGEKSLNMLIRDLIVAINATILLHMDVQNYKSEPVLDTLRVKEELMGVCDKRGKVARMIHAGELIQLRRGLYATRRTINPHCLAASIYGPSYISFDTALSFHGLIPDPSTGRYASRIRSFVS